jgi:hypothetical protein
MGLADGTTLVGEGTESGLAMFHTNFECVAAAIADLDAGQAMPR